MKKITRFSLLTLTAILLLCTSMVLRPVKANAWTGDIPQCTWETPTTWENRLQTVDSTFVKATSSIIMGEISGTKKYLVADDSNGTVKFYFDNTTNVRSVRARNTGNQNTVTYGVGDVYSPNDIQNNTNGQFGSPVYVNQNQINFTCIKYVNNVVYNANWNGYEFNSYIDPTTAIQSGCSTLDIACRIGSLVSSITNLGDLLLRGIASLFVPDFNSVNTQFQSLKSNFDTHLGFLMFPINFSTQLITKINNNITYADGINNATMSFGNLFGKEFVVDFSAVSKIGGNNISAGPVLTLLRLVLNLGAVVIIYELFHHRLIKVLGHK